MHLEGWKHGNRDTGLKWCVRSSGCYGSYGTLVHVHSGVTMPGSPGHCYATVGLCYATVTPLYANVGQFCKINCATSKSARLV